MVESGPAAMKNATSKAITTARASRFCARPGDKLERMKCCSSGSTAAVFTIGATLCRTCRLQHKLKDSALGFVRCNPQPAIMGLNDRTADRQTHPHSARFCREQWIEYPLELLRANSCSGVRHRYDYARAVADIGLHA